VTQCEPADGSRRRGERPRHHGRSDRTFLADGKWTFRAREGIDVGPYPTQEAAALLSTMLDGINDLEITRQFIKEFMLLKT